MNVAAIFAALAAAEPGRPALHAEGRWTTRGTMQRAIERTAVVLRVRHGIVPGDRVAYLGPNRSDSLVLLFALARIGAVYVPLNTRLSVPELATIVADAAPRIVFADDAHRAIADAVRAAAVPTMPGVSPIFAIGLDALADALADALPNALADATVADANDASDGTDDDPLLLAYTSGTTGAPRGAVHTHAGLIANAAASMRVHAMTADDRVLTVLPLFHVGGLCIQTLPALLAGAAVVLHPRFDARRWIDDVAALRPTLTLMVPATLRAVIAASDWATCDLSSLRVVMAGSSPVPRALIDAVHARGVPLGQIYGSTETGPVTVALGAADARRKAGFAGWPCFAGSVRLVDAAGDDVAPGTVGEIVVRAPNLMRGYWRRPADTNLRDGWFATGDLGHVDIDGCLAVVGRNRDLIITGGENVYPAEIEELLTAVDGIAEAAVVGRPDERWGEVPVAFLVRSPGTSTADEAAIAAALDGRLARYKHPKRIVFVDRLPRNAMGKVQSHLLVEGAGRLGRRA